TALGVDFPFRLYQLLVDDEETPPQPYRFGVYARNLTPDTSQIVARARALAGQPMALARFVTARIGEFGRMLIGREYNDTLVWDDPRPGLIEISRLLAATARHVFRGSGQAAQRSDAPRAGVR